MEFSRYLFAIGTSTRLCPVYLDIGRCGTGNNPESKKCSRRRQ